MTLHAKLLKKNCERKIYVYIVALMQTCDNSDFAILSYVFTIVTKSRTH